MSTHFKRQKQKEAKGRRKIYYVLITVSLVFFIIFLLGLYFWNFTEVLPSADKRDEWGAFGDYMGGILNPIFTFAGLIMLFITILMQREELSTTREMLEEQKNETKAANSTRDKQNDMLELQKFESSFFQMLGFYQTIVGELNVINYRYRRSGKSLGSEVKKVAEEIKGEAVFKELLSQFKNSYNCDFIRFIEVNNSVIAPYYRFLFRFLKMIDQSSINQILKMDFTKTLRSVLTDYQLELLHFNCLLEGHTQFKELFTKYEMFKYYIPTYAKLEDISLDDQAYGGAKFKIMIQSQFDEFVPSVRSKI